MSKHQLKELTQRLTALAEKLKWHNVNHAQDVALSSESITSLIERLEVADKDGREYAILAGTNAARAEKAERERDEYAEAERSTAVKNVTLQDEIYGLKAELARRDAAAGEPDGYIFCHPSGKNFWSVSHDDTAGHNGVKPFYFAAPPAVLPELEQDVKNIIGLLSENEWAEHCTKSELGRKLEGEITRLHDLRAQQQKVVELPEPVKWPEIPFKYFSEEQVFSMLDAARVKWEVKT